jgi:hypothetical protein
MAESAGAWRRWRYAWFAPVLAAVVGLALAYWAARTSGPILEADPCASGFDNPIGQGAVFALLLGVGVSVVLFAGSVARRNRRSILRGLGMIVLSLFVLLVGTLIATGAYGWHCDRL